MSTKSDGEMADMMTPGLQKLGRRGLFQDDNDPKHTAKMTQNNSKVNQVRHLT